MLLHNLLVHKCVHPGFVQSCEHISILVICFITFMIIKIVKFVFLLRQATEPRTHHHGDHVVTLIAELSLFLQVPYTFKSQGNATAAFFSCNTLTLWVQETFAGGLLINGFALTLQH